MLFAAGAVLTAPVGDWEILESATSVDCSAIWLGPVKLARSLIRNTAPGAT